MAVNLVSLVMQFLTPDMIGRIAGALGLDRSVTQTALGGAVPALLAGLTNVTAQPGGAQKLADAAKQQAGALDSLSSMIGGSGQARLLESGSQILTSLLGGQQTALTEAIGKFVGLRSDASGSLLGMLAPAVLGVIAKHLGGAGIDARSVASLLATQKDNIATALPAGLANQLKNTGLLDALGGLGATATAAAGQTLRSGASAARAAADTADRARRAATSATSASYNWAYWAIPALAVIAILLYLFARPTQQVAQQAPEAGQSVAVAATDLGKQATDILASLRTSLQSITDSASAAAAVPKLQDAKNQMASIRGQFEKLPPEQRKAVAGQVSSPVQTLNQLFDKVLAIPGVGEQLKPIVEAVRADLSALTAAT
jgi:hypothetical protein